MNLIIDIGNSAAKVALTQNGNITAQYRYADNLVENISKLIVPGITAAIISSTRKADAELEARVKRTIPNALIFDHTTPIPIENGYSTPETLGMDRLAAAVGAWSLAPDRELLIVDFGTAITIDRVTAGRVYCGGNISPGMAMRFAALNHFTERLPLISYDSETSHSELFGTTTQEAIWLGVVRGIENEIKGYVAESGAEQIFFTGRDANNFVKSLKNAIFADYELVIKGLDRILEHNAEK